MQNGLVFKYRVLSTLLSNNVYFKFLFENNFYVEILTPKGDSISS